MTYQDFTRPASLPILAAGWECPQCHRINRGETDKCDRCSYSRPSAPTSAETPDADR